MEIILTKLEAIEALMKRQIILSKEILTLEETGDYLGMSKSNIYKLTSKHEIPFYSPGGKKIYFRRSEIENWITTNKITATDEEYTKTEGYLRRISKKLTL